GLRACRPRARHLARRGTTRRHRQSPRRGRVGRLATRRRSPGGRGPRSARAGGERQRERRAAPHRAVRGEQPRPPPRPRPAGRRPTAAAAPPGDTDRGRLSPPHGGRDASAPAGAAPMIGARRGMTLLEVLVAVAVLATGVVAAERLLARSVSAVATD